MLVKHNDSQNIHMSHLMTKPKKKHVRLVKTQISLCAQWVAKDPRCRHADSKDWSDARLIRVFAGCTGHFVGLS